MPHTRWDSFDRTRGVKGAGNGVDLTETEAFCQGYLLALDDLLLDIDQATDSMSLLAKVKASRMATLTTLSVVRQMQQDRNAASP